jgi:hypothetical protein
VSELRYDPIIMALRGRVGGLVRSARHDGREMTASARAAYLTKLQEQVDPAGVLPLDERRRRAEALRRARLAQASLAAAEKRRASRARAGQAAAAPTSK